MSAAPDLFAGWSSPPKEPAGGPFVHPCAVCGGALAPYGFGVRRVAGVMLGIWTCAAHRAEGEAQTANQNGEG